MAVHVPLSVEAQAEARFMMLSVNNILAPKDGNPITTPSQDMVLGAYYMTFEKEGEPGEGMVFKDYNEMIMAYENKVVTLHSKVKVRMTSADNGIVSIVESTVGRFIFNEQIPQDIGFVDRSQDPYSLEVDFLCTKKKLEEIIAKCFAKHANTVTAVMLDHMKNMGFKYSSVVR